LPLFDRIILTQYQKNPRARSMEETRDAIENAGGKVSAMIFQPTEALENAIAMAGPDGMVVVTGSLFLAAEIRAAILGIEENRMETLAK
jgi:dihydrofolate synthase/folylpolyglutamate synthase